MSLKIKPLEDRWFNFINKRFCDRSFKKVSGERPPNYTVPPTVRPSILIVGKPTYLLAEQR